jgi:hypothetical protein
MIDLLPPQMSQGATLRGNEYGWSISAFPHALAEAESHGYACLGGQFQFRLDEGSTCEMYWLNADSKDRALGESWADYCHRSCSEVRDGFQRLVDKTDFGKEASSWPFRFDPTASLVFVAYFVTETDLTSIGAIKSAPP